MTRYFFIVQIREYSSVREYRPVGSIINYYLLPLQKIPQP